MPPPAETAAMNTHVRTGTAPHRRLLLAGLTALAFAAVLQDPLAAHAQAAAPAAVAPMSLEAAARLHIEGLEMEKRHDDSGAFAAFLASAKGGYPPAQRRLGEIYDQGNSAVERNYEQSIHWYARAYNGGEDIPWIKALNYGP